jgi:hypothetical protein
MLRLLRNEGRGRFTWAWLRMDGVKVRLLRNERRGRKFSWA